MFAFSLRKLTLFFHKQLDNKEPIPYGLADVELFSQCCMHVHDIKTACSHKYLVFMTHPFK
jgi:hypothetical protein